MGGSLHPRGIEGYLPGYFLETEIYLPTRYLCKAPGSSFIIRGKDFKWEHLPTGWKGVLERLLVPMLEAQPSWQFSQKSLRLLPAQALEKGQKGWSCFNLF